MIPVIANLKHLWRGTAYIGNDGLPVAAESAVAGAAAELGFTITSDPNEPDVSLVKLSVDMS